MIYFLISGIYLTPSDHKLERIGKIQKDFERCKVLVICKEIQKDLERYRKIHQDSEEKIGEVSATFTKAKNDSGSLHNLS